MLPEDHRPNPRLDRRHFCTQTGAGFGSLALASMLQGQEPKLPSKAKSVIFLFMFGGPSQVDLFDYKPELQKRDGQSIRNEFRRGSKTQAVLQASRRNFAQHGNSGLWCSDAFPNIAKHMDKLAMVKSLTSDSFAHGSALLQINCGRILQGHPSLGSWVNYGLGSVNQNLPGFVVMLDPRGGPTSGAPNWSNGYMPASYQGTLMRSGAQPILNLRPPANIDAASQRAEIDLLNELNRNYSQDRNGYSELEARIASYELAFQLQIAAPEAMDLSQETAETIAMYGIDEPKPDWHPLALGPSTFGRQCLIARRLVERGVRFIQIYSGGGNAGGQNTWDGHHGIEENLKLHCPEVNLDKLWTLVSEETRKKYENNKVKV
jgi:hypothetical protein